MEKAFRVAAMLALCMALLTAAAMASGSHDCVDADGDHLCDECWESVSANCADTDGDHFCDVCWRPVRTACADADGDTWCDVCGGHMSDYCTDADKNHACDVCWAVLGPCLDENKDHLCDLCGGVFWVDENADGICDGCEAVLTHVTAEHVAVYYHQSKGATLADVVLQITVEPYIEVGGAPAGTVAVRWSDDYGNSYSTAEKALTFGATTVTVEYPSLPMEALEKGGRVTFSPYDAGFTPAENGCVAEYDLPTLCTYTAGPILGTPVLTVQDEEGNPVTIDENTDLQQYLKNCSQEELDGVKDFVADYVEAYMNFTSVTGGQGSMRRNLSKLQSYMVPDSKLSQRMEEAIVGLLWVTDRRADVNHIDIHRTLRLEEGRYVCDLTYVVDTRDFSGKKQSSTTITLIIVETENGLKAESMTTH